MDYKFTSAATPDLVSQLHTVNQPTENSDRLKGGSLEMEAEVLSLAVYEKPPPPQRGKRQCRSVTTHHIIPSNKLWITRCDWVTTISKVTWVQPNCKRKKGTLPTKFIAKIASNNSKDQIGNC